MDIKLKNIAIVYCGLLFILVLSIYFGILNRSTAPKGGALGNNQQYTITLYAGTKAPKPIAHAKEMLKQTEIVQPKLKLVDKGAIPSVPDMPQYQSEPKQKSLPLETKEAPLRNEASKKTLDSKQTAEIKKDIKLVKGGSKQGLGGNSDAPQNYQQEVLMYLQQYRYYPPLALRRHISGTAEVKLAINCSGELANYQMVKSTGNRMLDDAVVKMIQDAGTFPAMNGCAHQVEMTLPIEFKVV